MQPIMQLRKSKDLERKLRSIFMSTKNDKCEGMLNEVRYNIDRLVVCPCTTGCVLYGDKGNACARSVYILKVHMDVMMHRDHGRESCSFR